MFAVTGVRWAVRMPVAEDVAIRDVNCGDVLLVPSPIIPGFTMAFEVTWMTYSKGLSTVGGHELTPFGQPLDWEATSLYVDADPGELVQRVKLV